MPPRTDSRPRPPPRRPRRRRRRRRRRYTEAVRIFIAARRDNLPACYRPNNATWPAC